MSILIDLETSDPRQWGYACRDAEASLQLYTELQRHADSAATRRRRLWRAAGWAASSVALAGICGAAVVRQDGVGTEAAVCMTAGLYAAIPLLLVALWRIWGLLHGEE